MDMLCAKICIIDINIYHMQMGFCRKVKKWFDGLNFGFSHLHDYLGLHDYPGLKSTYLSNSSGFQRLKLGIYEMGT